jgi:hypothetical protein
LREKFIGISAFGLFVRGHFTVLQPGQEKIMYTKPLVQPSIKILESSEDMTSINRLLAAAAVSPRFRGRLLADPEHALRAGFGGEQFPLSQPARELLLSIQASTMPDFVRKLDEKLSYRLHVS